MLKQTELYQKSRIRHEFFGALKETSAHLCEDQTMMKTFNGKLERKGVPGLPVMTHIGKDGQLALIGYLLDPQVCQAMKEFLQANVDVSPFVVKSLILSDNSLKDSGFAQIIEGITEQRAL